MLGQSHNCPLSREEWTCIGKSNVNANYRMPNLFTSCCHSHANMGFRGSQNPSLASNLHSTARQLPVWYGKSTSVPGGTKSRVWRHHTKLKTEEPQYSNQGKPSFRWHVLTSAFPVYVSVLLPFSSLPSTNGQKSLTSKVMKVSNPGFPFNGTFNSPFFVVLT